MKPGKKQAGRGPVGDWLPGAVHDKARLLEQVLGALASHRLQAGDRLPNERMLAEHSGLSRGAVRDTLAELERRGILTRHVGRGTYVAQTEAPGGNGADETLPAGWPEISPADLMNFRAVIEPAIVDLVTFAATDADLARLADAVVTGHEVQTWLAAEQADRLFHSLLFDCTGNQMFRILGRQISRARAQQAWMRLKSSSFTAEKWAFYQAEHETINEAIQRRDAERAAMLLRAHLVGVRRGANLPDGDI
jgi:DNA-binding FadR family transcriptional regulator